jgi:ABC-type lipoprotein release transport system permease subunit
VEFEGKISGVQLLGRVPHPSPLPGGEGNTFANQALADRIGLRAGETVSLRLMPPQSIPPESSLGRKDQLLRTRIAVDQIVPNRGIGRFSLKMDQQAEPLLIVPLAQVQRLLNVGDKVNAVFYMTDSPQTMLSATQREELQKSFQPTWEDLGIVIESHENKHYIKSARMLFTDAQVEAILR